MANEEPALKMEDVEECCRLKGQPVPLRNAPVNWPTEWGFLEQWRDAGEYLERSEHLNCGNYSR